MAQPANAPGADGPGAWEPGAWDVATADMNGDGRIDILSAERGPGNGLEGQVVILLNPGGDIPWGKWKRVELGPKMLYGRLAVGDIDHDGRMDVVALGGADSVLLPDPPDKMQYRLRWWLSKGGEEPTFEQGEISLERCPPECEEPCKSVSKPLPSSAALADIDSDDDLDLAVSSYSTGPTAPLRFLFFDPTSRSFKERPGWSRCSKSAMRVRFHDMDDDGRLDLIASVYHFEMPGGSNDQVQWGQWWRLDRTAVDGPHPLAVTLTNESKAELAVVDFDALRDPAATSRAVRFALALSAHHCVTASCWAENGAAGGFSVVADANGNQLWSSEDAQAAERKRRNPGVGVMLVPRVVQFAGEAPKPKLVVGYWWAANRSKGTCTNGHEPCRGPLLSSDLERSAMFTRLGVERFSQGIVPSTFHRRQIVDRDRCYPQPTSLLSLPHAAIASIAAVRRSGVPVPYQWVPGSRDIVLDARMSGSGEICVEYQSAAAQDFAIADAYDGVLPIESTDFEP
jgi:hypothetical protein